MFATHHPTQQPIRALQRHHRRIQPDGRSYLSGRTDVHLEVTWLGQQFEGSTFRDWSFGLFITARQPADLLTDNLVADSGNLGRS
jgi:hypothetical protein